MEGEGEGTLNTTADIAETEAAAATIAKQLNTSETSTIEDLKDTTTTTTTANSSETIPPVHSYQIKPTLLGRFKAEPVKEIIREVLSETLTGKVYDSENVKKWIIQISNDINLKVRELNMKRYKHIVQVTLGEYKGAGVKSGVRCLWDSETDGYTSDIYFNDTIFCLAVVYGIYLY